MEALREELPVNGSGAAAFLRNYRIRPPLLTYVTRVTATARGLA
jgi:hypothetical protein